MGQKLKLGNCDHGPRSKMKTSVGFYRPGLMDLGLSWCIRTTRRSHAHHFPSGQQIAFRDCRCNPVGPEQGRMPLSFDPQGTGEQIFQKSNTLVFQSQHFQLSNCCCWKFEAFSGKPSLLHFWSALFTSWQKWRNTFCLLGKSGAFLSTFPQIKYSFFFFPAYPPNN